MQSLRWTVEDSSKGGTKNYEPVHCYPTNLMISSYPGSDYLVPWSLELSRQLEMDLDELETQTLSGLRGRIAQKAVLI